MKMTKYQQLNLYSVMGELFNIIYHSSFKDRLQDFEVLCKNRAKEENISEEDALNLMIKERNFYRIISFIVTLLLIFSTIVAVHLGNDKVAMVLAVMPLVIVFTGVIKTKKLIKVFKEQNIEIVSF